MEIAAEISKILNEKTGCKLTQDFNGEVEHKVRVYELMSVKNGIEVASEIVGSTELPLLLLANAYSEESEIYEAACNEIAYTVLTLINVPLRNLFVNTLTENDDVAFNQELLVTLPQLQDILCSHLAKYRMGIKTKLYFEEMLNVLLNVIENIDRHSENQ